MKKVQDHYFHKAKQEGFVSRAVYKLEEIDKKHGLFFKKAKILDLGASPGGWMQYAAKQVPQGLVVGIDLKPLTLTLKPNMRFFEADLFEFDLEQCLPDGGRFDLVISDMAPKTSGIKQTDSYRSLALCMMALEVAKKMLKPKGSLLVKFFQGAGSQDMLQAMRQGFEKVISLKPKASRSESREIYLLGQRMHQERIEGAAS